MLPVDQIHSALLSSAACYLFILFYFRTREQQQTFSRFRAWAFAFIVFGLVLAAKLVYIFDIVCIPFALLYNRFIIESLYHFVHTESVCLKKVIKLKYTCIFFQSYDFQPEMNYYDALEVGRHSSTLDIRKAYKKMSKIYHPDKSPGPEMADRFQKIKTAYDVSNYSQKIII